MIADPRPVTIRVQVTTTRAKPDRTQIGDSSMSEVDFLWDHPWAPQVGDMLRVECNGLRNWRVTGREFAAGAFVLRVSESVTVAEERAA